MKTTISSAVLLAALLPGLVACSGDDDPSDEPGDTGSDAATSSQPTAAPAADGEVRTRGLVTVIDTGDGPQVCLGLVEETAPPQCGGPAVEGWSWKEQADGSERKGRTRWGSYALTGAWDGTTFTVADAVPEADYEAPSDETEELPTPSAELGTAELEKIGGELASLPGFVTAVPDEAGHLLVDVRYDDGSLQDYVDGKYGEGVVVVNAALVDA